MLILQLIAMLILSGLWGVSACLLCRRLPHSLAVIFAGLAVAGMLLFSKHCTDSLFIAQILPPSLLPVFGTMEPLLAGLLAGACWRLSDRPIAAKAVVLGLLLLAAITLPYRYLIDPPPATADRWQGSVCMQTTQSTCAAAATATLLKSLGISATEGEMAGRCFTTARGTGLHGIIYGLDQKLAGSRWHPIARHLTSEQLAATTGPAILIVELKEKAWNDQRYRAWGWNPGVKHVVVFYQTTSEGKLLIGDPATGREAWSREALDDLWSGEAVLIHPTAP